MLRCVVVIAAVALMAKVAYSTGGNMRQQEIVDDILMNVKRARENEELRMELLTRINGLLANKRQFTDAQCRDLLYASARLMYKKK